MLDYQKVLVDNKEFIYAVARLGLSPDKSSSVVKSILDAYNNVDQTIQDMAVCNTCPRAYENSFKTILAYCDSENWFEDIKTYEITGGKIHSISLVDSGDNFPKDKLKEVNDGTIE